METTQMYRCTRPDCYSVNTPGFNNLSSRQGYYIEASSKEAARMQMSLQFPNDSRFDIQDWDR